ncbi:MAG: TlpA family protein disulfide reductase [Bacteroidetes bacterium]|nr:TlpA family protein disulfide reductase [Bacteroidota bacterium]
MRYIIVIVLLTLFHITLYSQNVSVIKITDLEKRIRNNSDTTYIVNFWATWCVPCVKELPDFDSINTTYINKKVKVLLVSLDFKEDLKIKLIPFILTKKIRSEVVLLDELNANYFIPKISDEWTGAIPATLVINNQKKLNRFFEKKLNYEFLKTEIENSLGNH